VDRAAALETLARLHAAQGEFYSGGADGPLRALLHPEVEWHVPGRNAIAGTYRGVEEVMAYFARRRDHAARTFRMHPGDVLSGEGDRVAVLTDGSATIGGREERWSTVGLYRFAEGGRLAGCWLLPLDPDAFDRIWA
jgi:ketosteroid isomerase-like protein